ncbi:MAG: HlyC/CorC family transporter [Bacteroidetes bacterium]|nr:HlyC/CorC family transporter [Bacteroidota bacterium]
MEICIIITALIFSALFSGIEMAFISANKLHIELENKRRNISGKILGHFLKKPSKFITAILIGNTIALVVFGIFMASILEPTISAILPGFINNEISILLIQTLISTSIVLAAAEFLPKSIFMISPNKMIEIFSIPMFIIYYLLYPLVYLIASLSKVVITRIFRLEYSEEKPVFGLTDLTSYINSKSQHGNLNEEQDINTKIFNKAIEFKNLSVRDCLIPRAEIVAVDIKDSIKALKKTFIESGHTKILVYEKSIDNIIGYCHSSEMFKKPKKIQDILTEISIVQETLPANQLFVKFIAERKSLMLVADEFGGTSGVVSIEDVIEEIFGEIQDEYDKDVKIEQQIDENNYILSARHEIDYLNEKYNWNIPKDEYDTLGGFILMVNEDIPKVNDVINISPFTFKILTMDNARIETVKLTLKKVALKNP